MEIQELSKRRIWPSRAAAHGRCPVAVGQENLPAGLAMPATPPRTNSVLTDHITTY